MFKKILVTAVVAGVTIVPLTSANAGVADNAQTIYTHLTKAGVSKAGACGVIGNLDRESGLNPGVVSVNGEGVGLAQWFFSRKVQLLKTARKENVSWKNMNFQLKYMVWELKTQYPKTWNKLKTTTSVSNGAYVFHREFNASADNAQMIKERANLGVYWCKKLK